jgi:hypothetical protein
VKPTTRVLPFLLAIAMPAIMGGCWEDTVNVETGSSDRELTLTGRVLDDHDGTPITGATVILRGIERSATTTADGGFRLSSLALGTYRAEVTAAGYLGVGATLDLNLQNKAETDHRHLDIRLPRRTRNLTIRVVSADDMGAVAGAQVSLVHVETEHDQQSFEILPGQSGLSASSDDEGHATLTGLPRSTVRVAVSAVVADGDQADSLAGRILSLDLGAMGEDPHVVALPSMTANEVPEIIASNVPTGGDQLTDPILYLEFDQQMIADEQVTAISIYGLDPDEYRYYWVGSNRLEIAIVEPVDRWIEVRTTVYGQSGVGALISRSFYWRAVPGSGGSTPPVCEEAVGDLFVETVSSTINYDTRAFALAWTAVPCAEGYRVYARDDASNPGWVLLDEMPHDYDTGLIRGNVQLPSQFDRFEADAIVTPLAGIAVEMCVLPANAMEPSPGSPHAVVTITDRQPPALAELRQLGIGFNLTDQPMSFDILVEFSEFIGPDVADPVIEIIEAGGDPSFTLDPAAGTWIWDPGMHRGRFRFTLQPGDDATGDQYRASVADLVDLAGNVASGSQMSALETIFSSYSFDFENGAGDWSVVGTGWELGAPSSGPGEAYSGTQCWATTLAGNYANSTNTRLISPEMLIAFPQPVLRYQAYIDTESCCDHLHVEVDAGSGWISLGTYQGSATSWQRYEHDLSAYEGQTVQLQFRFTSDGSVTRPGVYLDAIAIEPGP